MQYEGASIKNKKLCPGGADGHAFMLSCEEDWRGLERAGGRRCTPEFPWGSKAAGATGGTTLQVPSALHRAQAVEAKLACLSGHG
jgi:hypothetical protein